MATVRVRAGRWATLVRTVLAVVAERADGDGWLRLELEFGALDHALAVVWGLGPNAEALDPAPLRAALADRAAATLARYGPTP